MRYKELKSDTKEDKLFSIRIEEFDSSFGSFSKYKKKDAYFSIKGKRLCFSKSIFVDEEELIEVDNNGNRYTSIARGFYIDENRSDEIDYEHCLVKSE